MKKDDMAIAFPNLTVSLPDWIADLCRPGAIFPTGEARMGLVIELARTNVGRRIRHRHR